MFVFRVLMVIWLTVFVGSITFSIKENTAGLLVEFSELLTSSKSVLDELAAEINNDRDLLENYQAKLLLTNERGLDESLNQELYKTWEEIERLEQLTKGKWLDALLNQLDSYDTAQLPPDEIKDWIEVHRRYIVQIRVDVSRLGKDLEKIERDYPIDETLVYGEEQIDASPTEDNEVEQVVSAETKAFTGGALEQIHSPEKTNEYDALEASLLYLLSGLEMWGQWLDPTNEIGLLPEAEGRFMTSNTPILQAGGTSISGGIGVVGFAQPIIISHGSAPQGFTEEVSEAITIDFDDSIKDVFQKVPYQDRLIYQYGIQIDRRTVQIYRKPVETELTLHTALQRMGAPPDVAQAWIEEYAAVAYLPQTIQLSWLIAGNPLAKDYKLHTEDLLKTFDINTLFVPSNSSEEFTLPQVPSAQWVNEDPFWEEVQNQPFLRAFTDLLSGASEEVQRSFIVSLFFLEPSLPTVQTATRSNVKSGARVRTKPFFWDDESNETPSSNAIAPQATPEETIDPDQARLVAKALQQKTNLIHYWIPGQGDKIIPWSEKGLLDPNGSTPYFIMAITALPEFEPKTLQTIARNIINNQLPEQQPVFKIFTGLEVKDRKIMDNKGALVPFANVGLIWSAEALNNDSIVQHATRYQITRKNPYVAVQLDSGPYLAGSFSQLKNLLQGKQDYTAKTIVLKSRGTSNYKKRVLKNQAVTDLRSDETWLHYATRVSADAFSWLPQKQDELLLQSTHRNVVFKRNSDLKPEIKTSTMVQWSTLPSNESLLEERVNWKADTFLMEVKDGYFFVSSNELEHLQALADETPKVHSLLLSGSTELNYEYINSSIRHILPFKNLDCNSIRVLSAGGMDLAFTPQCSVVITDSGRELAQADAQTLLSKARKENQPIVIFRPDDKPASALLLRFLVDAEPGSIEKLTVDTLVPAYDLAGLDAEEKESAIELSISDTLKRTLQFFPQQSTFEILMPEEVTSGGQKVSYTTSAPASFKVGYSYDKISILHPNSSGQTTFYNVNSVGENVEVARATSSPLEVSANDIYLQPSGEFNQDRIFELAQKLHEKSSMPYAVIKSNQGRYYAGSLNDLNTKLPAKELTKELLLVVTKTKGTNNRGFSQHELKNTGWLHTSSEKVIEHTETLGTNPNSVVNVWSAEGKRHAVFTADGKLQLDAMIQWPTRPDNQLLKSLRKTWEGHMILVNLPDQGYFLAQPGDSNFLQSIPEAQVDSIILAFDPSKSFSNILSQAKNTIKALQVTGSVRVMSNVGVPITEIESPSVYSGLDLAFKVDNKGELGVDLQRSGLELAEQAPEKWLSYTETTSLPLAIFEWSDGQRSSALFTHMQGAQDLTELKSQHIVPAYDSEELGDAEDLKERDSIIATSVQDTLQRAFTFLPSQTAFQVVMPDGKTIRHYSQESPSEKQIQPQPLGIIEVTRQSDNAKVKYYYQPSNAELAQAKDNDADVNQTLALLSEQINFESSHYQGTSLPSTEELVEKSSILFRQHVPNNIPKNYAVLELNDKTYFGGPWHKIREIANLNNVKVDTIVIGHKGVGFVGKNPDNQFQDKSWMSDWAAQAAKDVFTIFPQSSSLTVCAKSCRRQVVFRKEEHEVIDLAAMPAMVLAIEEKSTETLIQWWDKLPSNAILLAERAKWQVDMVLMHAPKLDRYFLISHNEVPYFEEHADQPVQIHTLVLAPDAKLHFSNLKIRFQRAVSVLPEHVSTIRVISAPDVDLSFDRECKLDVFGSCGELLQQEPSEWLATTAKWDEILVVFKKEEQLSGVSFRTLLETNLDDLHTKGITPHSLVPIYSEELLKEPDKMLSDPDLREEVAFAIAETLRQVYHVFSKKQQIKVLMPNGDFVEYALQESAVVNESDPLAIISFISPYGDAVKFYRVG